MKTLLVATDLSAHADRALERAVNLAARRQAALHVVHVMAPVHRPAAWDTDEPAELARAEKLIRACLAGYRDRPGAAAEIHVVEGDAFAEILGYADRIKAGLIVMGMHNKNTEELRDLFVGTTVERVIRKGNRPVLMVKDRPDGDYKRVLAATDFSAASGKALEMALQCAPEAAFHVIHTYDVPYSSFIRDEYSRREVEEAQQRELDAFLNRERDSLAEAGCRPDLKAEIKRDTPFSGIMAAVKEIEPGLLALGAHGRSGLGLALIGSTARDFLAMPPCDILVGKG